MLDLISAVQAELSGPRAANYSNLSDADAVTALQTSGQIYQDVPVASVEGYLRAKGIVTAFEDWLASSTPPTGLAKVAARELLGIITGKVQSFALSDPATLGALKAMMGAIAAESGSPFTAQNETDVLAFGVPGITAQTVTAARIMNGIGTPSPAGQWNTTPYTNYSWSQSPPQTAVSGQVQINGNVLTGTQNGNIYVLVTVKNSATGEQWVGWVNANDLEQAHVNKQAALMIASFERRDAALANLKG